MIMTMVKIVGYRHGGVNQTCVSACNRIHMPSNTLIRIKVLARDSIVYFIVVFGKLFQNDPSVSGVEWSPSIIILQNTTVRIPSSRRGRISCQYATVSMTFCCYAFF